MVRGRGKERRIYNMNMKIEKEIREKKVDEYVAQVRERESKGGVFMAWNKKKKNRGIREIITFRHKGIKGGRTRSQVEIKNV